jgi:hypothetical protein
MPPRPRKNRVRDTKFIADHASEMRFTADGLLVWSGKSEDIGSEYQLPPDEQRCHKLSEIRDNDGQPVLGADMQPLVERCPRWVMRRAGMCVQCANGSAAVQNAVRERIVGAADAIVGSLLEIAFNDLVPSADRIRALNSLLDRTGIRPGIEVAPDVKGFQQVLQAMLAEGGDDGPDA